MSSVTQEGPCRRFTHSPRAAILAVLLLAVAAGCGPSEPDTAPSAEESVASAEPVLKERKDSLYVLSTKIWLNRTIPVCWDSNADYNTPAYVNARAWVRDAVQWSWERVADVTFTGWGPCTGGSGGIRIRVEDVSGAYPHTTGLGTDLNGWFGYMYLNFTYRYWNTSVCQSSPEKCVRADAVHEFGHALGFAHEQLRPDNGTQCNVTQSFGDLQGDTMLGAYDINSIMNYCNPGYFTDSGKLSALDIQGVQKVYGAKPGSIVGIGGKCLDIAWNATDNWSKTELDDCYNIVSQRWARLSNDSLRNTNSARCLDVEYGSTNAGALTQLYDCNGGVGGQKWSFEQVAIGGFNGKCLEVAGGSTTSGARTQLWECNGTNAQKWTLTTSGDIRNASGKCLDVVNANSANNTAIQIWDCNGTAAQKWTLGSGGRIQGLAGKCLDVSGANGANGTQVVLYDCNGQTNQRWHLSGPIIGGASRRCLDAKGGSSAVGTQVQIWDCNSTAAQTWNYFP